MLREGLVYRHQLLLRHDHSLPPPVQVSLRTNLLARTNELKNERTKTDELSEHILTLVLATHALTPTPTTTSPWATLRPTLRRCWSAKWRT